MKDSKYLPLQKHLENFKGKSWSATFEDVEVILGFKLPASAYKYAAWWGNHVHKSRHAKAWMDIGWGVHDLDLANETLSFQASR